MPFRTREELNTLNSISRSFLVDVAVGVLWALLLAAVVAFESGISQFIYVDF
jgi:hypothetical protein